MAVTETSNKSARKDHEEVTAHPNLATALAAFHLERPSVVKDQDNDHFKTRYAGLDAFEAAILPVLAKHGLTWVCIPTVPVGGGDLELEWRLIHGATEQQLGGVWPLGRGSNQQVGSALTYAKRYLLSAVTGVSAGGDDDGEAGAGMQRQQRPSAPVEHDWTRVIGLTEGVRDLNTLRRIYAMNNVKDAPADVQKAFEAAVRTAQAAPEEQPA
jgi:hypothetical protein